MAGRRGSCLWAVYDNCSQHFLRRWWCLERFANLTGVPHLSAERLSAIAEDDDLLFADEEFVHLTDCTDCYRNWRAAYVNDPGIEIEHAE